MPPSIIIFGASGDLTQRKLIPALFQLHRKGRLPAGTRIVGVSRTSFSHEEWRASLEESTRKFAAESFQRPQWEDFAQHVFYQQGDIGVREDYDRLGALLNELEGGQETGRVYYLATAPRLYETAIAQLGTSGLADEAGGTRRIVVEKPFGFDAASSHALNEAIHAVFDEQQIYRIDHYLGKETVQNLLVLRFANSIFEPIWNRNYIDHVQITVAEDVTVGQRGGYYDTSGVIRDMFQNHLLQLLMITAMEAPVRFQANLVRDEKVKVLRAVRPVCIDNVCRETVRAQYEGYRETEEIPADSRTPTFAALKLHVDNWRWQGVPFYLRSGKAMSCRTTQIVIQFHEPPHLLFDRERQMDANRLVIQIQPAEGIQLHFLTKVPDAGMQLRMTDLDFSFRREFSGSMPDAYQRLLLDVLNGDASLFARSDEVELAWSIVDPIITSWQESVEPKLEFYSVGGWGPECSTRWMREQGREWFDVCPVLH